MRLVGPRGPAFDEMILMGQMTHSPLLTFRSPTADDVMRSPLRYVRLFDKRCIQCG